jgi:hypothetical protein
MSAKASTFKETDIKRAVRGAQNAGLSIGRLEIGKEGKISIVPKEEAAKDDRPADEWDEAFGKPSTKVR